MHLRQKPRLRLELSPKFLSTLGQNPAQTRTLHENPDPTYNSVKAFLILFFIDNPDVDNIENPI